MSSNTGECINNKISVILHNLNASLWHGIDEIKTKIVCFDYTINKKRVMTFLFENNKNESDIQMLNLF